jgi:hypothetical protein
MSLMMSRMSMSRCGVYVSESIAVLAAAVAPDLHDSVSMRLGFDGLAARVAQVLDGDPFICVGKDYVAAHAQTLGIPRQS